MLIINSFSSCSKNLNKTSLSIQYLTLLQLYLLVCLALVLHFCFDVVFVSCFFLFFSKKKKKKRDEFFLGAIVTLVQVDYTSIFNWIQ